MQTVITTHIYIDEEGRAWIDDTNTKVIEVVLNKLAYGWSPEEIHQQHPHLSLAQIHAALSYYYDHQVEIDAEIEQQDKEIEALMAKAKDSPLKKRLQSLPQKIHERGQTIIDENSPSLLDHLKHEFAQNIADCMRKNNCDEDKAIRIIFKIGVESGSLNGYRLHTGLEGESEEGQERRRA